MCLCLCVCGSCSLQGPIVRNEASFIQSSSKRDLIGDEHYWCLSTVCRLGSKQTRAVVHVEFKSLDEKFKPSLMISKE